MRKKYNGVFQEIIELGGTIKASGAPCYVVDSSGCTDYCDCYCKEYKMTSCGLNDKGYYCVGIEWCWEDSFAPCYQVKCQTFDSDAYCP